MEKKSCCRCSWAIAIIVVILLAVAGVLIWQFAPIGQVTSKVVPTLNNTFNGGDDSDKPNGDGGGGGEDDEDETDFPGDETTALTPGRYQFHQCQSSDNCCNGLDGLCDFRVNNIMWATVHNAMAARDTGFLFSFNHIKSMEESLDAGYRAISLDLCNCGGDYQLCHGICTLGARSPTEVFGNIVQFVENNPTEVVMINLQINSQVADPVELDWFAQYLADNVPGWSNQLYAHTDPADPWPTLGYLKNEAKQRLLLFHLNGPDCSNGSCPQGFHYWFDVAYETEFQFTAAGDMANVERSCLITRGGDSTGAFFAINSFVTPPMESESSIINKADFLRARMQDCKGFTTLDANLLYVDFWSIGDLPQVVQEHNQAKIAALRARKRSLRSE